MRRRNFLVSIPFIPAAIRAICRVAYIRRIPGIESVRILFERDNAFYNALGRAGVVVSTREMRIPLILRPGG